MIKLEFRRAPASPYAHRDGSRECRPARSVVPELGARIVTSPFRAVAEASASVDAVTIDLTPPCGEFSLGGDLWPGLSKVAEEIGELGQVVGKIIGAEGAAIHFDGSDLRERFVEEAGDVLAAIDVAIWLNDLPLGAITARRYRKRELFQKWHAERLAERNRVAKVAA